MSGSAADLLPVVTTGLAGAAAFFLAGACGAAYPSSRMWGPVISRGTDAASRSVALTFDDGPLPGSTDRILDTLRDANARATFFVIGRYVREFPDLVRRMHDEGHLVANHSHDHLHSGLFGRYRYWMKELARADDAIEQAIGRRPAIYRPPMGYKHWHVMNAAADIGLNVVTWTRRAIDTLPTTTDHILRRLAEPAQPGDILLLHDGNDPCRKPTDRTATCDSVRPLIDAIRQRGLEFARLDDLLKIPGYRETHSLAPVRRGEGQGE